METTLQEFIKKTVAEIQSGLPEGYELSDEIAFDISVITTTGKQGKVDIKVISGEVDKENQIVHNINFGVVHSKAMDQKANSIISYVQQGLLALNALNNSSGVNTPHRKRRK